MPLNNAPNPIYQKGHRTTDLVKQHVSLHLSGVCDNKTSIFVVLLQKYTESHAMTKLFQQGVAVNEPFDHHEAAVLLIESQHWLKPKGVLP